MLVLDLTTNYIYGKREDKILKETTVNKKTYFYSTQIQR